MNNTTSAKTKELLNTLENIENSYNPASPAYKFTHVFYNIVDFPVVKPPAIPQDIWDKYFIPNSPLMPVILNKEQIDDRRRVQDNLFLKLTESRSGILKRLENLRFKREMVKSKLQNTIGKFRERMRKYIYVSEDVPEVYRIRTDIEERERYVVREREEVLSYLVKMRERLELLEKRISESVRMSERGIMLARHLDSK